jgi:hypothetical protein
MSRGCLLCPVGAKKPARTRGLCRSCYNRCAKEIRQRQTTWAELERKGLALPAQRKGEVWRREWARRRK